ncbi:MAG: S-methyl-5-thioribose kinase [Rhodospirillales bacterium]|nr:S-methyl-5-thioribose kinase [Rhodospirillales bacterium]
MTADLSVPLGYRALDLDSLRSYVAEQPRLAECLGGAAADWQVEEVGDGNLNLVFKLHGPKAGFAVKQALPYVRLVGESWPLPLSRAHYEHEALTLEASLAPGRVPAVAHYDESLALIAMELLEPHIIMRHGTIAGTRYPNFVEDITDFTARCYFLTSDMALPAPRKKGLIGTFAGNTALCKITEDLIFTEPYMTADNNRWTSPYLDGMVAALQQDQAVKRAISRLKLAFMSHTQALLHGDLHAGSIMLTTEDTRVIDPEFAFVGPIGFDMGSLLANLLISYFSQAGHEESPGARDGYRDWLLECVSGCWTRFEEKFLALWRSNAASGDGYSKALFQDDSGKAALDAERVRYMHQLFADTVGFTGAELIRRTVGLAHNIDFEWIEEPALRAHCEARAIALARDLLADTALYATIDHLVAAVRRMESCNPLGNDA